MNSEYCIIRGPGDPGQVGQFSVQAERLPGTMYLCMHTSHETCSTSALYYRAAFSNFVRGTRSTWYKYYYASKEEIQRTVHCTLSPVSSKRSLFDPVKPSAIAVCMTGCRSNTGFQLPITSITEEAVSCRLCCLAVCFGCLLQASARPSVWPKGKALADRKTRILSSRSEVTVL